MEFKHGEIYVWLFEHRYSNLLIGYIGSSQKFEKRKSAHLSCCILNKHSEKWKNLEIPYNIEEFYISCEPNESCYCTKEQLRKLEQEFINEYKLYTNEKILLKINNAYISEQKKIKM